MPEIITILGEVNSENIDTSLDFKKSVFVPRLKEFMMIGTYC